MTARIVAPAFPARHRLLPCNDNPQLFQPDGYGTEFADQIADAKTVCHTCPAKVACREWAVGTAERPSERHGIWGATTPDERTWIRRKRGLPVPRAERRTDDEEGAA